MSRRHAVLVPEGEAREVLNGLSKSDLMELVWDFAATDVGDELELQREPALALRIIAARQLAIARGTWVAPARALEKYRAQTTERVISTAKAREER
jgi:hypothetical protein